MTATILPFPPQPPAEPYAAEFMALMEAADTGRAPEPIGQVVDLPWRTPKGPCCLPGASDRSRTA